jgi:hypothetical protein
MQCVYLPCLFHKSCARGALDNLTYDWGVDVADLSVFCDVHELQASSELAFALRFLLTGAGLPVAGLT